MNRKTLIVLVLIVIAFFLSPLLLELVLTYGLFGWKPFTTAFSMDDWLAFWASYLGGGLTIIAIWVSVIINNENLKNELAKEERALNTAFEQQKIAFDNELKKERIRFERRRLNDLYDEIIDDIEELYYVLMEDSPISLTNLTYRDKAGSQKIINIIIEIDNFYRKYYREPREFHNILILITRIRNDISKIIKGSRMSIFIAEEIEDGAIFDEVSKCILDYKLELRENCDALIDILKDERDDEIAKLYENGDNKNV